MTLVPLITPTSNHWFSFFTGALLGGGGSSGFWKTEREDVRSLAFGAQR